MRNFRGILLCTKTRLSSARTEVQISYSQQANRNSTLRTVSQTSLRDVRLAVTLRRTAELSVRCSQLYAQDAAVRLRFLSSPVMTDLFTAASALLRETSAKFISNTNRFGFSSGYSEEFRTFFYIPDYNANSCINCI